MEVIPPRDVDRSIPEALEAICLRALAHEPRDRFRSMAALADALLEQRFANGWREGAADLARIIQTGGTGVVPARATMITAAPVALMTRSLLAVVPPYEPEGPTHLPPSAFGDPLLSSGANTNPVIRVPQVPSELASVSQSASVSESASMSESVAAQPVALPPAPGWLA